MDMAVTRRSEKERESTAWPLRGHCVAPASQVAKPHRLPALCGLRRCLPRRRVHLLRHGTRRGRRPVLLR